MVQKDTKRPRGRPRAYDPEQALAQAMATFWESGYTGTSLDMLSVSTGMNRPSLYAAFGDKHALYLAALERYAAHGRESMRRTLTPDRPLAQVLSAFYRGAIAFYVPEAGPARGCLLLGTAATEAVADAAIRAVLGDSLRQHDAAFATLLRAAQAQGQLPAHADPAALASVASAIFHELAVRARAGDSREVLTQIADSAVQLICGGMEPRAAGTRAPARSTAKPRRRRRQPARR